MRRMDLPIDLPVTPMLAKAAPRVPDGDAVDGGVHAGEEHRDHQAQQHAADRRLLDEGRRTRSMLWIMAIMLFLTVLAGALGLGMARAARALDVQGLEARDQPRMAVGIEPEPSSDNS